MIKYSYSYAISECISGLNIYPLNNDNVQIWDRVWTFDVKAYAWQNRDIDHGFPELFPIYYLGNGWTD